MSNFKLTSILCLFSVLLLSPAGVVQAQKSSQTADLTAGERKAISFTARVGPNTVVIFDKEGNVKNQENIDPAKWDSLTEYATKICSGPVPISPKCVRCKDGGIICANAPKKKGMQQ